MSKTTAKPKKKFSTIGKIAVVEFDDHWSRADGWNYTHNDHAPLVIKGAGIIIHEDDKVLQITTHQNKETNGVGNIMTILKKCITKRKNI